MHKLIADRIREVIATGGGFIVYFLGGWDAALQFLVTMIMIDYLTGLMRSFVLGDINSNAGYRGLLKKAGILIIIAIITVIDQQQGMGGSARIVIINAFTINEALSSLENLGEINVPMADKVAVWLEELREKLKEGL